MGRFVEISIDSRRLDAARARDVAGGCPVDIFWTDAGGALGTHADREDECILCGRCVASAPEAVRVRRAYGAQRPVAPATGTPGDDHA
jgi:NAD-dependent dihydropyrimidine dehydrogenase PreA subunit